MMPFFRMPPQEARSAFEGLAALAPKLSEPVAHVEDRHIPGPCGNIGLRIYTPVDAERPAALLYIHGGGWVIGSVRSHDDMCRSLCHRAGVTVVSVNYRLAARAQIPWAAGRLLRGSRMGRAAAGRRSPGGGG